MNGVDKADQLIAYYRPSLCCRRTWMSLMFHVLDCIRVNAFILTEAWNKTMMQKDFIKQWDKSFGSKSIGRVNQNKTQCYPRGGC